MYKFVLCFVMLFSACNNSFDASAKDAYEYYVVYCKHPLGHVMRHVVSSKSWRNSYGSRSGVYRFRDTEGVFHENSTGCYTNDKMRVDKAGNLK